MHAILRETIQVLASADSHGVFSLLGQGGDLPVLRVPCRDGDGQTPGSPWRKPAPSIAASPQRNLTPWPLSLRDDAVQQESSPAASGIPREARFPSPFATPRGVDQRRPAVSGGLLSRPHRAASRNKGDYQWRPSAHSRRRTRPIRERSPP